MTETMPEQGVPPEVKEEVVSRFSTPINDVEIDEKDFDVVIDGSGLVESILAGSLARSGMRILHIDENEYYGGDCSSLTWSQYELFLKGEKANTKYFKDIPTQRGWNIDLNPKGLLSGGDYVETLISSSVGKYLEFKFIDRSLVYRSDSSSFVDLPAGKSAIFTSKDLAPMEKRRLMQLFQLIEAGVPEDHKNTPISTYLSTQLKMNEKVADLVKYSILRLQSSDDDLSTEEAVSRLRTIAESIGRYGPTDMIYSSHGLSELPQAMSRVCAIYKGISCILRRHISEVKADAKGRVSGVTCCAGQSFTCKHFITSSAARINGVSGNVAPVSRCVVMAADSLFDRPPTEQKDDGDDDDDAAAQPDYPHTLMAVIAPGSICKEKCLPSKAITIFELSSETSSCPKGVVTVHFSSQIPIAELTDIVLTNFVDDNEEKLRTSTKASVFHRAFFTSPSAHQPDIKGPPDAANIWRCPLIQRSDVDEAMLKGRQMFTDIMAAEVELRGEAPDTKTTEEGSEEEWAVDFDPTNFLSKLPDPEEDRPLASDPEAVLLGISSFEESKEEQPVEEAEADETNKESAPEAPATEKDEPPKEE